MRSILKPLLTTAAVGALVVALPSAASADGFDGGESTPGGYGVGAASVTLSGDYSPGLQASVPGPPPLCWWEPVTTMGWPNAGNPQAVMDYFMEEIRPWYTSSTSAGGAFAFENIGGEASMQAAVEAEQNGRDVTWYHLETRANDMSAAELAAAGCGLGTHRLPGMLGGGQALITIAFFDAGNPPEPVVDPEVLAEYAYEVMDLVSPTLDWNPTIDAVGGATLVNLPTWLWVEDPAAVGTRSVTATAGTVSATVTAETDGVSITSPAGTVQCDADEARTAYARGVSESSACTLPFNRASWGYGAGFPVRAQSTWNAAWTSNVGESGDLEARSVGEVTDIPVAETQSVVNGTD